jgi:hypothetical protein
VTLIVWTAARYFLYASYFTIFGVLFGFKNFGKMVAIDNTFNGLIGANFPTSLSTPDYCQFPRASTFAACSQWQRGASKACQLNLRTLFQGGELASVLLLQGCCSCR